MISLALIGVGLWALASQTSAASLTQLPVVRATTDSSRTTPTTWSASMTVEANYVNNGDIAFSTRSYCYRGVCSYPGPTIELVPGDNFSLTLKNNLGANPAGEDTTMNSMHSPNSTNLHTHGLHINPRIDTVFTHAAPGETIVYNYEVPSNHASGTHWYHDHTHGGSALRVMGGLCGAIIIRPSGAENLPSSITAADEHLMVLTQMHVSQTKDEMGFVSQACSQGATCDPATQPPDCTAANQASSTTFAPFRQYTYQELSADTGSSMDTTVTLTNKGSSVTKGAWTYYDNEVATVFVNGQYSPSVTAASSQAVTLRIVHAAGGEELKLGYSGPCTMQVIATDGVYLTAPWVKAADRSLFMMAGARADIQMSCTGTGVLYAATQFSRIAIATINVGGSGSYSLSTAAELGAIIRPYYLNDLTSVAGDVVYASHVSQGNRPIAQCGCDSLFWWGAGSDCSGVLPWGTSQPSSTSTDCPFGFFGGSRGEDASTYTAANKLVTYLGDGVTGGEVNEWSLYGLGNSKHPLHLHVHHMQIVSYECVPGSSVCTSAEMDEWIQVGQWRDVLPTFEGKIKVRFRVTDFPGETVLHCHFLRHEDLGMMDSILVKSGKRSAAAAATTTSAPAKVATRKPTAAPSSPPAPGAAPPRAPPAAPKPPAKGSDASETATAPAPASSKLSAAASKSLSIAAALAATGAMFLATQA